MHTKSRLFLLSFLLLFVELTLIRWTGASIIYLSYFSNFVLLGSFLGIGVGFLRVNSTIDLFPWAPVLLALLVLFIHFFPVEIDRSSSELLYFGNFAKSGLPIWTTLPIIFIATAITMAALAQGTARTFIAFKPLTAYQLDILGSIAGIAVFSLLAFLSAPPVFWAFIITGLLAWLLADTWLRKIPFAILCTLSAVVLVSVFARESLGVGEYWSPYYKLHVQNATDDAYLVFANGIPHQTIESVNERHRSEPFYFFPYQHRAPKAGALKNVLIIGAGTGGDTAIALQQGAQHIDAVEIDPKLYHLGQALNPDQPYRDPRVQHYIGDGRAFLQQTQKKYDMIIFALPDSLTLVAGQSSLRLESYLFTIDAIKTAKTKLTANGVLAMYNYYRQQWLIDRLANTLQQVFQYSPCIDANSRQGTGLAVLTIAKDPTYITCNTHWLPASNFVPTPATDDHPFLYLYQNSIPGFYLITLTLVMGFSLLLIRIAGGPLLRPMKIYLDLFFLGVAFLLLETKSIVGFALLFGTTWFVNALVFAGILITILAAVTVTRYLKSLNSKWLYGFLLLTLIISWLVPLNHLLAFPFVIRFITAVALTFSPIFLANLIFAERFRQVSNSATAFGINLLGAMAGGLLEYVSLITGYQALLLVIAVLYSLAFVCMPRFSTTKK